MTSPSAIWTVPRGGRGTLCTSRPPSRSTSRPYCICYRGRFVVTPTIYLMEQERLEAPETEVLSAGSHEVSDRDLIAEVLRKDRKATAEFVARCADPVYSYVRHRLFPRADLVEDLVQEVFLAAWQSLDKF